MERGQSLLGVGIYTVPEAARMTSVSPGRIRRWMKGYAFRVSQGRHVSPRLWTPELPEMDGVLAVSFRDMIEVRFVNFFRECGVSWPMLRRAAERAAEHVKSTHPFSTNVFRTDGRRIFADQGSGAGRSILDIVDKQHTITEIVAPFLYKGLVYEGSNTPVRWFPLESSKRVVIDPQLSFGHPIVFPHGVPTSVLAGAASAAQNVAEVAGWYEVTVGEVEDAITYEQSLAA